MRKTLLRSPVLLGLLALAACMLLPAPLQAQTATGGLAGTVTEGTAPLPGVTVTATNVDTGFTRSAVTAADGLFRLSALQVGNYAVKAELAGFATVTVEKVEVRVATSRTLDIAMQQAKVAESVTVTAEVPLVETTPSIGTVVSQQELQSLPLNGRQFANLGVLAPGTTLDYNTDPTKPGQLVIAMNGGSGRNVNYLVDGGDNMDDTIGGALQNYNLEAVQEFKIQTMQYKAEYGRSSGGILTVVTKTGSNDLHGSAYGFFRKDAWNSQTESEKIAGADKQAYDRKQYGASIGGPIVKDKVHFFGTYEQTKRDTNYIVDSGGIYPELDGQVTPLPFQDELITAKVTYDINAKQYLQVRYGYQKNTDKYGASSLSAPSNLGTLTNKYDSILAGYTASISGDMLNEFIFQYSTFDNIIAADSADPLLLYPSGFAIGRNVNTPQSTQQVKYQYRDDFTFSSTLGGKTHDFKAGIMFINEPSLGGDFSSGLAGQYTMLAGPAGGPEWVVSEITKFGGFSGDQTPSKQYSAYFQDDWRVSPNFTLNIGLRYDYYDALYLDQGTNPIYQVLSTQTTYNESYLKDFQGWDGITRNDKNGWAPRVGFSWDIKNDGKHILRGGLGRFYDFPYSNATVLFPAMAVQSDYGVVYSYLDPNGIKNSNGTYFQPGQPLPPNQLPGADIPPPNEVASPTLKPPYSDQISLGYSWQATNWLGFNLEAVKASYRHLPFRFRANPIDPTTGVRRFPDFGSFRVWYGKGEADYQGVNLGVRLRGEKFEMQGFYTYSKTDGNILGGADEFRITRAEYQPDLRSVRDQTVNPYDPLCSECFGLLDTDATHRVTFGGTYRFPYGFAVSGMLRYRSATPYTVWAGADVKYNDGYAFDLPPDVSEVNSGRGHSFSQFDLRVSKEFSFGGDLGIELIAEMFNVLNSKNPAGYIGNIRASNYGEPTTYAGDPAQGEQRLMQLGLRVHF
ncbi:MAG: TonB-dependent receptor [Thermoanaerobaculaceae bacterium]|nr:TonB-dependent receptor [Thermoanaerobaculaceae bacterium]